MEEMGFPFFLIPGINKHFYSISIPFLVPKIIKTKVEGEAKFLQYFVNEKNWDSLASHLPLYSSCENAYVEEYLMNGNHNHSNIIFPIIWESWSSIIDGLLKC